MKSTKYRSDEERSILTGMLVNDRVLGRIAAHLKNEKKPFRSKWCNLIGQWCLTHFAKYGKAPRQAVQNLFREFAQTSKDEDAVGLVETFLESLSSDYKALSKELNEEFLIDAAARFFNKVKLERLNQSLATDLENQDVEAAQDRMVSFHKINLATTSMIGVLDDQEAIRDAVTESESDVLISYPNGLGEFFGQHLARDSFVVFLAPEKRGKTFWLLDTAWRASILNKRRTLFYSVGDMTQRQMMRRFITRAARRPIRAGELRRPIGLQIDREKVSHVKTEFKEWAKGMSVAEAVAAMEKVKLRTAFSDSLLKMRCTSNSTTNIADIRGDLEELKRSDWIPDVIVIDYADILAAEPGTNSEDFRHRTNETWKAMRRLSQDYHALVISATQSDAASYDAKTLRRGHFSEDKRKLAHVTGMVGINQTDEEKKKDIFRLNWVALREGAYTESQCVTVAGCLALCNPAVLSIM